MYINREVKLMSAIAKDIAKMVDILPESDQELAYEFMKKLILAWDPDYTKVTDEERKSIKEAEESGFVAEEDIDWNDLSAYRE